MNTTIHKAEEVVADKNVIYLTNSGDSISEFSLTKTEKAYLKDKLEEGEKEIAINSYSKWTFIQVIKEDGKETPYLHEEARKAGAKWVSKLNIEKQTQVYIIDKTKSNLGLTLAEGLVLGGYKFNKYKTDLKKDENFLKDIYLINHSINQKEIDHQNILNKAVYLTRDLVNEPLSFLTAEQFSKEIIKIGKEAGFSTEILDKEKIKSLKMGGLLAVNKGSIDPPTFNIMEWKPETPSNQKPIILVGKGVVFDTGGLSLKPTKGSMDLMKSDMAGAAAVTGAMFAAAKAKLPIHLIALVPATDNRPGQNAYVPQDVITMYNGKTVEVLNTDAEGRMILADALSFADKYNPDHIIELSTLTGAAAVAIGHQGVVAMGNISKEIFNKIKKAGENVHERIVEFPFWDEYKELLKSDIADLKNIGGRDAGAITAGKFLEYFTESPYLHIDIAGPGYIESNNNYKRKGGTGVGVRLIFNYLKNLHSK